MADLHKKRKDTVAFNNWKNLSLKPAKVFTFFEFLRHPSDEFCFQEGRTRPESLDAHLAINDVLDGTQVVNPIIQRTERLLPHRFLQKNTFRPELFSARGPLRGSPSLPTLASPRAAKIPGAIILVCGLHWGPSAAASCEVILRASAAMFLFVSLRRAQKAFGSSPRSDSTNFASVKIAETFPRASIRAFKKVGSSQQHFGRMLTLTFAYFQTFFIAVYKLMF